MGVQSSRAPSTAAFDASTAACLENARFEPRRVARALIGGTPESRLDEVHEAWWRALVADRSERPQPEASQPATPTFR